jgi:hypothetical protein
VSAPRLALAGGGHLTVLGIDVGDTTGMLLATWDRAQRKAVEAHAFQCDRESAPLLLGWICSAYGTLIRGGQVEEFRDSIRARKLAGTRPGPIRAQVPELAGIAAAAGIRLSHWPAVTVKGWGTDDRLKAAGLLEITAGQPHARDGGRHAIYCATHDYGLSDPLSRKRAVSP